MTRILTDYLRKEGFNEPREKASLLIQQLRERNFILCYRGADSYGFMHRTFLEYFCVLEIVHRFEKQKLISFEQLRDEVFGQHWQDKNWHEVLRLICEMIDLNFTCQLIQFLMNVFESETEFDSQELDISEFFYENYNALAISIARDIKLRKPNDLRFRNICSELVKNLMEVVSGSHQCFGSYPYENESCYYVAFSDIAVLGAGEQEIFKHISSYVFHEGLQEIGSAAIKSLADNWTDDQEVVGLLVERAFEKL